MYEIYCRRPNMGGWSSIAKIYSTLNEAKKECRFLFNSRNANEEQTFLGPFLVILNTKRMQIIRALLTQNTKTKKMTVDFDSVFEGI